MTLIKYTSGTLFWVGLYSMGSAADSGIWTAIWIGAIVALVNGALWLATKRLEYWQERLRKLKAEVT